MKKNPPKRSRGGFRRAERGSQAADQETQKRKTPAGGAPGVIRHSKIYTTIYPTRMPHGKLPRLRRPEATGVCS
jgi:hypothetical protein